MAAVESRICPDLTSVTRAAADAFVRRVDLSYRRRGACYLAVTGGPVAERLYETLTQTRCGEIPWHACHVLLCDERAVAFDDEHRNAGGLARRLGAAGATVHRVPVGIDEAGIRTIVPVDGDGGPVLDLIVLTTGGDGHMASLYPDLPAADTLPLINHARCALVMVSGPGCLDAYQDVRAGLRLEHGPVLWFVDSATAPRQLRLDSTK